MQKLILIPFFLGLISCTTTISLNTSPDRSLIQFPFLWKSVGRIKVSEMSEKLKERLRNEEINTVEFG